MPALRHKHSSHRFVPLAQVDVFAVEEHGPPGQLAVSGHPPHLAGGNTTPGSIGSSARAVLAKASRPTAIATMPTLANNAEVN
jgi:hypothetical protein